jgi:hypothetical protein
MDHAREKLQPGRSPDADDPDHPHPASPIKGEEKSAAPLLTWALSSRNYFVGTFPAGWNARVP